MKVFEPKDHFQVIPGEAPIVVGAPHHGTHPNVNADQGTGPIALMLAAKLKARAVIVSDLRHTVDVNKNPAGFTGSARFHAVRYQNELFDGFPPLIIEIHGHITGNYPVEVATGFDLSADAPGDILFMERLHSFRSELDAAFLTHLGQRYAIGIFPLQRNVRKTATNTFTFQKIRRARNLTGMEWYGLHIELPAEMRTGKQAQSAAYIEALTEALAYCIRASFEPLPAPGATIPPKADSVPIDPANRRFFEVAQAMEKFAEASVAVFHPDDLKAAGMFEGDQVALYHAGESLHVEALTCPTVQPGQTALPARVRRQINVTPTQKVGLGLRHPLSAAQAPTALTTCHLVLAGLCTDQKKPLIRVAPAEAEHFGFQHGDQVSIKAPSPLISPIHAELHVDESLPTHKTVLSRPLTEKIPLTLGEVVTVEGA